MMGLVFKTAVLVLLAARGAVGVLHDENEAGASVDVKVDSSFPGVVLTPATSAKDFCSYTLTGIYESNARQSFFDPRVDSDIANTRVVFSEVDWTLERRGDVLALVGVPHELSQAARRRRNDEGKEEITSNNANSEEGEEAKPRFTSVELLFTLHENKNATSTNKTGRDSPFEWKGDDDGKSSADAAAEAARRAAARAEMGMEVHVHDYRFISNSSNAVLVLEWELMAGTPINEEDEDALTRTRRRITAGDCVYDAGEADASDDLGSGVRCEVRYSRSVGGARFVSLYQSYSNFHGTLDHTEALLVAAPGTQSAGQSSAASTPHTTAAAIAMVVAVLVVALATTASGGQQQRHR